VQERQLNETRARPDPDGELEREHPLPLVEASLERLYEEPHSVRERRAALKALGQERGSW